MTVHEEIAEILKAKYGDDPFNTPSAIVDYLEQKEITPPPEPPKKLYLMQNAINWGNLGALPLKESDELTYFVLLVAKNGDLTFGSPIAEAKFVADVHAAGKKATFSIAGGSQNDADITAAVLAKTGLVNAIASRIKQFGYDGVTVDIENTKIDPQKMVEFFLALRLAIGPTAIIGVYTQSYQLGTVWSKIELAVGAITWLAPMLYDSGAYNAKTWKDLTNAWLPKLAGDKTKLLSGVSVNYPPSAGGLNTAQFGEVIDMAKAEGWRGLGIWNHALTTEPWLAVIRAKV